jgi:hyperosmotically inducible periplasmic protein
MLTCQWGLPDMNNRTKCLTFAAALAATLLGGGCSKAPEVAETAPAASAAAGNVSDIDVTEHVKTALLHNESLKGFDISVVTLKGDVRLTGMLDNQAQIDEALKIARASDGAHTIHDELTIKK